MKKKHNRYIGSSFDEFLEEEGILQHSEEVAAKRVFVFLLEKEMKKQKLSKEEMARRMQTSRSAVDRVLDPDKPSTFTTFSKAARAVGKQVKLTFA